MESAEELSYRKGRKIGMVIGTTASLMMLSFAYIVSQYLVYVD